MMVNQNERVEDIDQTKMDQLIKEVRKEKNEYITSIKNNVYQKCPPELQKCMQLAEEKGSSLWLNTLPIQSLGHVLNKQEFQDSLALRYNWAIHDMSMYCGCGKRNSIDHALICAKGGYVIMRHNEVRDLSAELLRHVCRDVNIEPQLIPLSGQRFSA